MNESEGNLSLVFPQQAVTGDECLGEPIDAVNEILLAFAVVVQMDFDVGDSFRDHPLQGFQEARAVLLLGIEERIARRPTGRIRKLSCNSRPTGCPSSDPCCPRILVGTVPERLIVIGKEQPQPLSGLACERGEAVLYICCEPNLAVSGKCHDSVSNISKAWEIPRPRGVFGGQRVRNSMKRNELQLLLVQKECVRI